MTLMFVFRNIFTFVVLISLFFSTSAYPEVVKKVDVKGNERVSLESILIFGDIEIGKNYEETDLGTIIKKLYETNFFSNIELELKNNKLTLIVKENPIVNSLVFQGEETEKYKEKIIEFLETREKTSFVSSNIQNDVNRMKGFYRALGYYFVKIDADIEKLEKNNVNIIYTIDRGEKAKISKIYFLGDKKFRDKRLRDVITSEEARFWKFLSRNVFLNEQRVDLDKRLLKNYYRNKGYYEVEISSSNVEYAEGKGFVLSYSINAGKRYKFKKISAEVDKALDNTAFLALESEFNKLIGQNYSQTKLNKVMEKIDKLSEQKELQFINHEVLETLVGDGIEVKINIFEGKKFIIERINVAGNTVTNDSVIRGELLVDEGDPYSELLVNKSVNRLKARRIFSSVKRKTLPGSSEDLKVLLISVEEKATGEIMAGAGVGTEGTSFMFSVKENNWLGKGINLASSLSLSTETVSGNIDVTDPNYKFTGNSVTTSLFVSSTDREASSGFQSDKSGATLGTSFEQYENVYFSPSIDVVYESIESKSTASSKIQKMDGTYFNSNFTYGISLDKRDQSFQPTEGYITSFFQTLPIIQDSSSVKNTYNISGYHDFSEDIIGALKFQAKNVIGIDDDVRLTDRLYLSSRKLRGFVRGKVGPKDGSDWVGGNNILSLNAEAQLPNLLPEAYKTDFAIFADTANIWGVDYDKGIDDSSKIRSSVGVGANVLTPIGPLSWTYSQNITKASTDETETFNFNIGTSF